VLVVQKQTGEHDPYSQPFLIFQFQTLDMFDALILARLNPHCPVILDNAISLQKQSDTEFYKRYDFHNDIP